MKTFSGLLTGLPDELLRAARLDERALGLSVSLVTSDSRQVRPGAVFVAIRGASQDGHQFISSVQEQGAAAIVGEAPVPFDLRIPYLRVPDARQALALLAANFHGRPSESMLVLGVTGTSGKTTTTYLIESILQAAGRKVGVIGTVNFRYGGKIFDSTHTTPGSVELQHLLAQMRAAGCDSVVMEVSSHALKQHRTSFIAFDGVVFTNLSPEHLDFHPDMEDYFRAKRLLFTDMVEFALSRGKQPFGAINGNDPYGKRLIQELLSHPYPGFRWSDFLGAELTIDLNGIRGRVPDLGNLELRSELTGRFNAENVLGAVAVTRGLGIAPAAIVSGVSALQLVPGRLERVPNDQGIHVLVDYAHKPDALEKVLRTLSEVRGSNRLITVFGCGGDRDRKKRPVMGRISVEISDHVVVTSDNPRTEDPDSIIREILKGILVDASDPEFSKPRAKYEVEPDRKKAIALAISKAQGGDIVLIAGKGHEDYQIIADPGSPGGTRKIHFDDREVAAEALSHRTDRL